MKNYQKSNVSTRRSGPTVSGHAQRWVSNAPAETRSAQRNYERYLALARAEAQNGNTVAAENYYQHAEHYFRSMLLGQSERECPRLKMICVVQTTHSSVSRYFPMGRVEGVGQLEEIEPKRAEKHVPG